MQKITRIICAIMLLYTTTHAQKSYDFTDFPKKADRYLKAIQNIEGFTGTVLVAFNGEVKFHRGYGMASKRFNIPNSPDVKYRIGSMTKSFTAICILQLVEAGRMSLDDRLAKYHKEFPFADEISIKHLLSHTSGLKRDIDFPENDKIYPLEELVEMSKVDTLLYTPGTMMTYSNCGYVLLQSILEKITGEDYKSYVTKNVLNPLDLKNTGIEDPALPPVGLADGFESGADKNGLFAIKEAKMQSHGYPDGVGAMYSTTEDLFKFCTQIGKSDILSQESWKLALSPFLEEAPGYRWGYGFNIIQGKTIRAYNHNGRTTGFRGGYFQFSDGLTMIFLGNCSNAERESILMAFRDMLLGEDYYQPKIHTPISCNGINLKDYTGAYKTENFPFEIIQQNKKLYVKSHGDPPSLLIPHQKDAFFNKYFDLEIQFKREAGKVTGCDWIYRNRPEAGVRVD